MKADELKLWAWDKVNREMCEVIGFDRMTKEACCKPICKTGAVAFRWHEIDRYEFLRPSGFTDKDGVDIYEGDKCCVQLPEGYAVHAFAVFADGCFELHFVSPIVVDGRYTDRDYLKCWVANYAVEVIGNKYGAAV